MSAADQLADFFTAATRADQQVRRAAALVNQGVGTKQIVIDPATVSAVKAIDTRSVSRAIPGGLPTALLRSTLQVYADLADRSAAMDRAVQYADRSPLPRASTQAEDLVRCLGKGSTPTKWFATDLAVARSLAAATPAIKPAPAESRAAAEVAIRVQSIDGPNGCSAGECGSFYTHPIVVHPIVWQHINRAGITWDGTVGTTGLFRAQYTAGQGWVITVNAC